MVEGGSYYLTRVLHLTDYLKTEHYLKFGLRFFVGDSTVPWKDRVELGLRDFLPFPSFQINRGRWENDLRAMNEVAGVVMLEDATVTSIDLSPGRGDHQVVLRHNQSGETRSLGCRWLIDATGRFRMLQRKLRLMKDNGHRASAAWWRLKGEFEVAAMVPESERAWHEQTNNRRYYSTNHIMGEGYWVWLIPLASGFTSVGIVADENVHPLKTFRTYERACDWLKKHEPRLAEYLCDEVPEDFLALKDFSYTSEQIFSEHRWACVGEAGLFSDPLYSIGLDFIGITNSLTTRMIELDLNNELTPEFVREINELALRELAEFSFSNYRNVMPGFKCPHVTIMKVWWDTALYFAFTLRLFYFNVLDYPEHFREFRERFHKVRTLNYSVQRLLYQWAMRTGKTVRKQYHDYSMSFLSDLLVGLFARPPRDGVFRGWDENFQRCEEWAQVMFRRALEETAPEKLAQFQEPFWVNAWALSLDSENWEKVRLLDPPTAPRSLQYMQEQVGELLSSVVDSAEEVPVMG